MKKPVTRYTPRPPVRLNKPIARHGRIRSHSRGRAIWGILFKALGLVLGIAVAITGVTIANLSNSLKKNSIVLAGATKITSKDLKGPLNILLIGSDTRKDQGKGYGNDTSELADVILLLHISQDRKHATALSFPRDLMVPWPRCPSTSTPPGPGYLPQTLGQINATISNGGPGCTLLTVEKLTGLKIPYLAMIDFKGVIELSNAIGGVEVCLAKAVKDPYSFLNLPAGKHVLQGKDALRFLRTRHAVGDGSDLARISNQQVFLTSLVRKVKSGGVLTNPIHLYSLAAAVARNVKLSESLTDLSVMVSMASALKDVDLDKMNFLQVPTRYLPEPYLGRVAPLYETAELIFKKLREDKPIVLSAVNTGYGAVVAKSASPSPKATKGASPTPSASPSEKPLPSDVIGTRADTTTCSN